MALKLDDTHATPRSRWVWAVALAPLLPAVNWVFARSDIIGVRRPGEIWFEVTGPPHTGLVAFAGTFLLLAVVPLLLTRATFGRSPRELGLGAGNVRLSLEYVALGVPIAIAFGYLTADSEALRAVYPLGTVEARFAPFALHSFGYFLYYVGFEYYFRGFLLFGLKDRLGPIPANVLQAGIVTLAHLGKPGIELAAAFPASLLFGWLTLRTGSIWPVLLIHWALGVTVDWMLVFG